MNEGIGASGGWGGGGVETIGRDKRGGGRGGGI